MTISFHRRRVASILALVVAGCAPQAAPAPSVVIAPAKEAPPPPATPSSQPTAAPAPGALLAECRAVVEVINHAVTALEKMPSTSDPTGLADIERMAAKLEAVGREMDGVPITVPDLRARTGEYRAMLRGIAAAERALVAALRRRDTQARAAAESALEAAIKKEDPVVDALNRLCQSAE